MPAAGNPEELNRKRRRIFHYRRLRDLCKMGKWSMRTGMYSNIQLIGVERLANDLDPPYTKIALPKWVKDDWGRSQASDGGAHADYIRPRPGTDGPFVEGVKTNRPGGT